MIQGSRAMTDLPIYLDYNATTPVDPQVLEAMLPYLWEHYGNPSSAHSFGRTAHTAVEAARSQVATMLGCTPSEVIFTSGGTEANNTAIKGVAEALARPESHIITSRIEHPAVLKPCNWLAGRGVRITRLPVDARGRVDPDDVARAITPDTVLISVMLANNEIGTLEPLAEISAIAHERGVLVHTDAAQAVGKVSVDVRALGVDYLSVAGHKLYAPKGIGVLYVRAGAPLKKQMHGASHEADRRAGTENVPYIAGIGKAAELITMNLPHYTAHMQAMRDQLYTGLLTRVPGLRRNGDPDHSLPNTLSVSIPGAEANVLVDRLSPYVAVSAGAACHADSVTISAVLQAIGTPLEYAKGTLRLSVGRDTTPAQISAAVEAIAAAAGNPH